MLVVAEPCTILCLRVTIVWLELSAPIDGINIVITTKYMIYHYNYVFIIIIHLYTRIAIHVQYIPGSSMAVVGGISSDKSGVEHSPVDGCRTEIQNAQFCLKFNNLRDPKQD